MKVDLTMNSSGFARHFEQAAHDGNSLLNRVWSAIRRAKDSLIASSRRTSGDEAFLAKSQNLADLERRIVMLQNPECHQFHWLS
jgi:hypothetical protein